MHQTLKINFSLKRKNLHIIHITPHHLVAKKHPTTPPLSITVKPMFKVSYLTNSGKK